MTRLLLLLALVFAASGARAQTWEFLSPTPTGNSFSDIQAVGDGTYYLAGDSGTFVVLSGEDDLALGGRFESTGDAYLAFADPAVGWVATGDGKIFRTDDAGQSWTLQYESDRFALVDISATDAQSAWAIGRASFSDHLVLRTTDGGQTWAEVSYPRRDVAGSVGGFYIRAFDAQTAVAVDYTETVYRTSDGGATWDSTHVPAAALSTTVTEGAFFLDPDRGWIVGPNQTIAATTDGGQTWARQLGSADSTNEARGYLTEVGFADAQTGWATSFGCLYRTSDGGATWTPTCDGVGRSRDYGLLLEPGGTGFVLEYDELLRSTDGGDTFDNLLTGYRESIQNAAFFSDAEALAVTSSGDVLRTEDGWESFDVAFSDPSALFHSVDVADGGRGWAVGNGGAIRATADGGDTWTTQASGVADNLLGVAALSATAAVAVGNGGTVVATTDGGATWTPQESGVAVDLYGVHFVDGDRGWAVGAEGTILATADGSTTWSAQDSGVLNDIGGVHFLTATTGFAYIAFPGNILGTTDGGATWTIQSVPPETIFLSSLFFLDEQTGWAGGFGFLIHTTNGGGTWSAVAAYPYGGSASDIYFASVGEGWVFGDNGTVLGFSREATSAGAAPGDRARLAVFPNPTAGPATLAFGLDASAEVELTVHDALGRAVARQRVGLGAGEHRVALPAGLAPGLYVVVASAGGERLGTTRFTVVR
jgi:photosystem II stability/assembly factor-like uncharacterized protein